MTKNKIKIAIVGYGFVGKATDFGFNKNCEKLLIDPKLKTSLNQVKLFSPDFIFICLPTPMLSNGSQDIEILIDTLRELSSFDINSTIIIKSTVLPDNLLKATKIIPNLIYNPEFLREKFCNEDFINSPMIVIGGSEQGSKKVAQLYKKNSSCLTNNYIFTDIITASLLKYTINSFLATKVLFFNQLKNIFDSSGALDSWDNFVSYISFDIRMGGSHMSVPGHDGKLGFGGACFTKDTAALLNYAQNLKVQFDILEKAVQLNNSIRSLYEDIDQREKDQNVNYDFSH